MLCFYFSFFISHFFFHFHHKQKLHIHKINRHKHRIRTCICDEHNLDKLYEDSIQELNILIGELDSFQKEHELKQSSATAATSSIIAAVCDYESNYDIDKLSIDSSNMGSSFGYSIHSNCSDSETQLPLPPPPPAVLNHFNYSDTEINRYMLQNNSQNSISATNIDSNSEIIHLQDSNLNQTELYVKENAEIVVLRRKDSCASNTDKKDSYTTDANDYPYGNQHQPHLLLQQRFSSFKSNDCSVRPMSPSTSSSFTNNSPYAREDYKIARLNMKNMEMTSLSLPPVSIGGAHDNESIDNNFKSNSNERLSNKPLVSPRPTSLSGLLFFMFYF